MLICVVVRRLFVCRLLSKVDLRPVYRQFDVPLLFVVCCLLSLFRVVVCGCCGFIVRYVIRCVGDCRLVLFGIVFCVCWYCFVFGGLRCVLFHVRCLVLSLLVFVCRLLLLVLLMCLLLVYLGVVCVLRRAACSWLFVVWCLLLLVVVVCLRC